MSIDWLTCSKKKLIIFILINIIFILPVIFAATTYSTNFIVTANSLQDSTDYANALENAYKQDALAWLGCELPSLEEKVKVNIREGPNLGAGGSTTYYFDSNGKVKGIVMDIQGSRERLLDSVIPHEVNHIVFAIYIKQPILRWADEGAATSMEASCEQLRHWKLIHKYLLNGGSIPFNDLFRMMKYPKEIDSVYAQGLSLANYLIQLKGRIIFLKFVKAGTDSGDWVKALKDFYGINSLIDLQNAWLQWVLEGSQCLKDNDQTSTNDPSDCMNIYIDVDFPDINPQAVTVTDKAFFFYDNKELSFKYNKNPFNILPRKTYDFQFTVRVVGKGDHRFIFYIERYYDGKFAEHVLYRMKVIKNPDKPNECIVTYDK